MSLENMSRNENAGVLSTLNMKLTSDRVQNVLPSMKINILTDWVSYASDPSPPYFQTIGLPCHMKVKPRKIFMLQGSLEVNHQSIYFNLISFPLILANLRNVHRNRCNVIFVCSIMII